MRTLRRVRFTRLDWIGDATLTAAAGLTVAVSLLLPWANEKVPGGVNFGFARPPAIGGVLDTRWGPPMLALAIALVALGVGMLALGPRRWTAALGGLGAVAGILVLGVTLDAARVTLAWGYSPGLGVFVSLLAGLLLIPIGLASATVGTLLARRLRARPDPGTAPPS